MKMTLEEVYQHIPVRLTPEMEHYATEEVFRWSRYIFTRPISGRKQMGYCTYCKQEFEAKGLRHGSKAICPSCQSQCRVRASRRGRKYLHDEAYFTYYLKSAIDPEVVVAIGTLAVRDYSGDYGKTETLYKDEALYVFRAGASGALFRRSAWYSWDNEMKAWGYEQARTVRCQYRRDHNAHIHCTYSRESLAEAIKGTPFQYSTWEAYDHEDMTEFMDLYARYPSIEYLTKLGFRQLVVGKLMGEPTYGLVHWRGRNPLKVLRLTKQELKEVRSQKLTADYDMLRLLKAGKKDKSHFTVTEASKLADELYPVDLLFALSEYGQLRKIAKYLLKQAEPAGCWHAQNPYHLPSAALSALRDYLEDCRRLDMNLREERVVFPKSLYLSHQQSIARVREMRDQEAAARRAALAAQQAEWDKLRAEAEAKRDELIKKRLKRLNKLRFEHLGLLIRPAESVAELKAEGDALHHCVARYAEDYASGKTTILLVRRTSEPDRSFYTVEVFNGQITQCYGSRNCKATEEVQLFMGGFAAAKLRQPEKPERQEVAV